MSLSGDTPRDNLTLSEADLAACRPMVGEGGHVLRARCPFHGSDRQRSLRVQLQRPAAAAVKPPAIRSPVPHEPAPARLDLAQQLATFQAALPGSRGAA